MKAVKDLQTQLPAWPPSQVLICLALGAATLAAYWPVLHADFLNYDDPQYVTENPFVRRGLTIEDICWAFSTFHAANWHPLTWLSHMVDCQLFGLRPGAHHAVNLLFHLANTLLLFRVFVRMTGAFWRSAFTAALFALHPLHVESVAWVAERKDVLSTCFGLLSLGAYVRYATRGQKSEFRSQKLERGPVTSDLRPVTSGYYWLSLLLLACSLMSKPMLVTLPCLLLLLDYWPLQRLKLSTLNSQLSTVFEKLPFLALSLASCVVTVVAQRSAGAVADTSEFPLTTRLANAAVSYFRYARKMFWPSDLAVFYPHLGWPVWQVLCAGSMLVLISILALKLARRRPWLAVGWLWFLGTLVPVIGLAQVGMQAMADRYSYLPLVGLFIILASESSELMVRRSWPPLAGAVAALCVLCTLGAVTFHQVRFWNNSIALFRHTLVKNPQAWIVCHNLAVALYNDKRIEESILYYHKALELNPSYAPSESNLGYAYAILGRQDEAIHHCKNAVRLQPAFAPAHNNLGIVLSQEGKPEEAIAEFRAALGLDPDLAEAYQNWGAVLGRQGKFKEALAPLASALRLNPDYADARRNLALAHYQLGSALARDRKPAAALAHWRQALQLNRDWPALLNALAWTLATNPDAGLRNGSEAVQLAQRACARSAQPAHFDTLAAAYAEAGRFPEAVKAGEKAMALTDVSQTNCIATFRSRLSLYQSGKPYHEPQ